MVEQGIINKVGATAEFGKPEDTLLETSQLPPREQSFAKELEAAVNSGSIPVTSGPTQTEIRFPELVVLGLIPKS